MTEANLDLQLFVAFLPVSIVRWGLCTISETFIHLSSYTWCCRWVRQGMYTISGTKLYLATLGAVAEFDKVCHNFRNKVISSYTWCCRWVRQGMYTISGTKLYQLHLVPSPSLTRYVHNFRNQATLGAVAEFNKVCTQFQEPSYI